MEAVCRHTLRVRLTPNLNPRDIYAVAILLQYPVIVAVNDWIINLRFWRLSLEVVSGQMIKDSSPADN